MPENPAAPMPPFASETPAPPVPGFDPIRRCTCGVPLGTAHYCAARDHNWVKAPERPEPADG